MKTTIDVGDTVLYGSWVQQISGQIKLDWGTAVVIEMRMGVDRMIYHLEYYVDGQLITGSPATRGRMQLMIKLTDADMDELVSL